MSVPADSTAGNRSYGPAVTTRPTTLPARADTGRTITGTTNVPPSNGRSTMTDAAPVLKVPQDVLDHFAKLGVDPETFSGGHLGEKLGIRIVEASPDRVVGTMPVE